METEQISSKKFMLNYGLILGGISVLFSVSLYATNMYTDPHWSFGIIGFLILISTIILGIIAYKKANNGFLTLSNALKIGIGIALIGGILSGLWNLVLTNVIEPDYTQQVLEVQREKMSEMPNMTEEMLEQSMSITEKMSSPAIAFAAGLIGSLFFGFIISLIGGLIMQKKEQLF